MRVGQLRELLEDLDDEVEVMIASQPSWPLAHHVSGAVLVGCDEERIDELERALDAYDLDGDEGAEVRRELEQLRRDGNQKQVLWIAEGSHPYDDPYLPGIVAKKLDWR